jgi:hypothetical protein
LLRHVGLRGLCSRRFVPRTTDSRRDPPVRKSTIERSSPPLG